MGPLHALLPFAELERAYPSTVFVTDLCSLFTVLWRKAVNTIRIDWRFTRYVFTRPTGGANMHLLFDTGVCVVLCCEIVFWGLMARWLPILALRVGPGTANWLASVTGFLLAVTMVAVVTASCAARFHRNNKNDVIRGSKSARKFPGRALINSSKKLLISWKCGAKEDEEEADDRAVMEEKGGEDFVWQRNILMGERCEPLNFSGLIIYDDKGNRLPQFPPRSPKPNIFQPS